MAFELEQWEEWYKNGGGKEEEGWQEEKESEEGKTDEDTDEDTDKEKGFEEIINSPIYKEFVISNDGKTSGILVYIKSDKKLSYLIKTTFN